MPPDARIQWTVFVSAFRDQPASRTVVGDSAGPIPVPIAPWECTYSAPHRAHIDATHWSEVRTIECTHGEARVSTTGFCQVAGADWGARAGLLSLSTRTAEGRVEITLDCAVLR